MHAVFVLCLFQVHLNYFRDGLLRVRSSVYVKVAGAIRGPSISELLKLQLEQLEEQRKNVQRPRKSKQRS